MLYALEHVLAIADQAAAHPIGQRSQAFGEARRIVEDQKTLDSRATAGARITAPKGTGSE